MRRLTHTVAAPAAALTLLLGLVGCGDDGSAATTGGLDSVTITGEFGEAPEVTWDGELLPDELETEVLVEGEGDPLTEGDEVVANLWIGNGFTQTEAYSSFGEDGAPETLTVSDEISPGIKTALEGGTVGSRVVVAAPPDDAFGEMGNPSIGIGNGDGVLFVVDILGLVPAAPTDVDPDQLPELTENRRGLPNGFDFSGIDEPSEDAPFLRAHLTEGDGDAVKATDTVRVHYLGMTYGADKPFDRSFGADEPAEFPLSGVVTGWSRGLTGVTVGSRVLLQIPPLLGYGSQEQGDIPANSTLYFVVDVVEIVDPAEAADEDAEGAELDLDDLDLEDLDMDDLDLGDLEDEGESE